MSDMDVTNLFRDFGYDVAIIALVGAPLALAIIGVRWRWLRHHTAPRPLLDATLEASIAVYAAAVGVVTLVPKAYVEESQARISWDLWASDLAYGPERTQVLANFVLLAPLVVLGMLRLRTHRSFVVGGFVTAVLLPIIIELAQAYVVPGRVASVEDVIVGASGGVLGAACVWAVTRRKTPTAALTESDSPRIDVAF